ncbi:MAG TPA: glycosyl hydrolase [Terriglobia bacterium]|nr:glycosyl hydrolase [Terriglobia bacterium]
MDHKMTRRDLIRLALAAPSLRSFTEPLPLTAGTETGASESKMPPALPLTLDELKSGWNWPSRTYRPRVFWSWPGNDVTKDGITWHLRQMKEQGLGGVKIRNLWNMYTQGNIAYLSGEYMEMVRHTLQVAEQLDMEVSFYFGPGWTFGGFWVPPEDRSKMLLPAWVDVKGPAVYDEELPVYKVPRGWIKFDPNYVSDAPDENKLVAVVAGKLAGDGLDGDSLVELTGRVEDNRLRWDIPAGNWRIVSYRLKYTGQMCQAQNYKPDNWVVDHYNKGAMARYCDWLGGAFFHAFGSEFGKTVETLHCDSLEVKCFPHSILWSTDTLELFRRYQGYDLTRYLPAIWWDIGKLTPKIRNDVNKFMHWLTMEGFMKTFINWCTDHGVQASMQPHDDIPTEHIEAAGLPPRSETEITIAGFEVVSFPRKDAAAGVRFYGKDFLQAEAFTWIHRERFRTKLEEIKIAADGFLRDGVTQFHGHQSDYTPEMEIAPSRLGPWAVVFTHGNTWWGYLRHVTDYLSRSSFLLRQGAFVGDILIYSPQGTVWTQKALPNTDWRVVPYGDLGKTLVANGYDFDPVNDDVLEHQARIRNRQIDIRGCTYRIMILPDVRAVPVATMEFFRSFVAAGGVLIALSGLPIASVGLADYERNDARVRAITAELFGEDGQGREHPGGGRTYHLGDYEIGQFNLHPHHQPIFEPAAPLTGPRAALVEALHKHVAPDFAIEGGKQSEGLMHLHRRVGEIDIYFVTNLQMQPSDLPVTFRVRGKEPQRWDPVTGNIDPVHVYRTREAGVEIPLRLAPLESTFVVFMPSAGDGTHVTATNLLEVREVNEQGVSGIAEDNGRVTVEVSHGGKTRKASGLVSGLPKPLDLSGKWRLVLEGYEFERIEQQVDQLASWTADPRTEHFSGTGRYELTFSMPPEYLNGNLEWMLDLGAVGDIAEVILNGTRVGVRWMRPHRLDVTRRLQPGSNQMKVLVTNTLINRVSAMGKPTEVPPDLVPHYGPTPHWREPDPKLVDAYCTDWRICGVNLAKQEFGFSPLPASGLLGPVRIIPRRKVRLRF